MKIKHVQVLTNLYDVDKVNLTLDATSPFPNMDYPAHATIEVQAGYGIDWAVKEFSEQAEIQVINCNTGENYTLVKAKSL